MSQKNYRLNTNESVKTMYKDWNVRYDKGTKTLEVYDES